MNLSDKLQREIEEIRGQRYQLLIIPQNGEFSIDIRHALKQMNIPILNLNLILSSQLKDLPPFKRPIAVRPTLQKALAEEAGDIICLEKIEYLFDPELKQDPLRLLAGLSGNKVILLFWPGEIKEDRLIYATAGHPEFYEAEDFIHHVIQIE